MKFYIFFQPLPLQGELRDFILNYATTTSFHIIYIDYRTANCLEADSRSAGQEISCFF